MPLTWLLSKYSHEAPFHTPFLGLPSYLVTVFCSGQKPYLAQLANTCQNRPIIRTTFLFRQIFSAVQ